MSRTTLRRISPRLTTLAVVLPLTALVAAAPTTARQVPGEPTAPAPSTTCPLERVGTQFVRCDILTGNGVPAPHFIPEHR